MVKTLKNRNAKEDGTIIIEGILFLSMFLFLFMMFYSTIKICLIEAKVNHALCGAAKEISQYSYLYAFTGAKGAAETVEKEVADKKQELKDNVVSNIDSVINGIDSLKNHGSEIHDTISSEESLGDKVNALKQTYDSSKGEVQEMTNSATKLFDYFKSNLGSFDDMKKFGLEMIKIIASDGFELIKNWLGQVLAESMCSKYFCTAYDQNLYNDLKIDYSKTRLFPSESDEIILVAEYKVRIIPLIPVKLEYTISQQVITTGWLYGDRNNKSAMQGIGSEDSGKKSVEEKQEALALSNSIWVESQDAQERAKYMRHLAIKKYEEDGYYLIKGNSNQNMYNPDTNEILYIGSSDPLYGCSSMDDLDESAVEKNMLRMIGNVNATEASTLSYKKVDEKGNTHTESSNLYEKGTVNKTIVLVVPDDDGLAEKMQEIWDNIPDEKRNGVVIDIQPGYGKHFADTPQQESGLEEN